MKTHKFRAFPLPASPRLHFRFVWRELKCFLSISGAVRAGMRHADRNSKHECSGVAAAAMRSRYAELVERKAFFLIYRSAWRRES